MTLLLMRSVLLFTLCAGIVSGALAASFDCAKARTPVEKMVCSDPLLGRLDFALARNYKNMLSADFGGSKEDLRRSQLKWLSERNKCKDAACLIRLYRARVDETCEYGVVSGVHPGCTPSEDIK